MIYLHDSAIKFHGQLNTSNCLIDSRWVVKVSDFGLHQFKSGPQEVLEEKPSEKKDTRFTSKLRTDFYFRVTQTLEVKKMNKMYIK